MQPLFPASAVISGCLAEVVRNVFVKCHLVPWLLLLRSKLGVSEHEENNPF